jgi:AcrR family transcriptional regulator
MSDPSSKTSYHHGDLRAQLIAAVRDLVETHGPEGFSVAEAARRAGVSSAAPYKHFKDRPELLRAVASEGLDILKRDMTTAMDRYPRGSLEAVAAIGQAYVDFARRGPGVFRLVFGLTEGHEEDADLQDKGMGCFAVVLEAVGAVLGMKPEDSDVQARAYILWSWVHGHSFLTIDSKTLGKVDVPDEWGLLMQVSRSILREPGTGY